MSDFDKIIKNSVFLLLTGLLLFSGCGEPNKIEFPSGLAAGDLVFLKAPRGDFWRTNGNQFNDIGIVMEREGKPVVLAVTDKVEFLPVADYVARRQFDIKRLIETDKYLHPGVIRELDVIAYRYINAPVDHQLSWDNQKLYSAELVWKIYFELLMMQQISVSGSTSDLKWSKPAARKYLDEHFKGQIPEKQTLIFPDAIYNSPLLETVYKK